MKMLLLLWLRKADEQRVSLVGFLYKLKTLSTN